MCAKMTCNSLLRRFSQEVGVIVITLFQPFIYDCWSESYLCARNVRLITACDVIMKISRQLLKFQICLVPWAFFNCNCKDVPSTMKSLNHLSFTVMFRYLHDRKFGVAQGKDVLPAQLAFFRRNRGSDNAALSQCSFLVLKHSKTYSDVLWYLVLYWEKLATWRLLCCRHKQSAGKRVQGYPWYWPTRNHLRLLLSVISARRHETNMTHENGFFPGRKVWNYQYCSSRLTVRL